jgi:hypothetical protein
VGVIVAKRTSTDVNIEFTNECARLGLLIFQKHALESKIQRQLFRLEGVNNEAELIKQEEACQPKTDKPSSK